MSIEYELSLNKLTTPPSYSPRVRPRATIGPAQLAAAISSATTMNEADVAGVLIALAEQVQTQLLAGNWVALDGIGILTTSLTGRLATPTDPLPEDSTLELGYRADSPLRARLRAAATYERIDPADQAPLLLTLTIKVGGILPDVVTNNVLELLGDRLGLDPAQLDEGVFLVPATGPALRVTNYLQNGDKKLLFALPGGITDSTEYTLQVRNRRQNSVSLRTTSWPTLLIGAV